jgi:tetratricopeptide (TPR) repeat protein
VALILASCASIPAPEQGSPSPAAAYPSGGVVLTPSLASFEQQRRDRAEEFGKGGKWTDAAAEWEILALLRPERVEYAKRWDEAKAQARTAANSDLEAAAEAHRRGDFRSASAFYLKVLSADPGNTTAAEALREIERDQAGRLLATHWANSASTEKPAARRRSPADRVPAAEQQELESAVMLLHQGDYAVSVQKLQDYLRRHPQDELARKTLRDAYAGLGKEQLDQGRTQDALSYLEKAQQIKQPRAPGASPAVQSLRKDLAQDYYEQGVRIQRSDLSGAIRLWEQALQYDPDHTQAQRRLKQARQMERNLDAIESAKPKQ